MVGHGASDGAKAPLMGKGKEGSYGGTDTSDDARFYLGTEKAVLFNTAEEGLTEAEAAQRLEKFGKNQLPEKEDNKLLKLAYEFVQPMPCMIWAAIFIEALEASVQHLADDWIDVAVLLLLQLLNVFLGFFEELKAGSAIAALKDQLKPEAIVKRGNRVYNMNATMLVPGDRIILSAGACAGGLHAVRGEAAAGGSGCADWRVAACDHVPGGCAQDGVHHHSRRERGDRDRHGG